MSTFMPKLYIHRWIKHETSKYLQIVQRCTQQWNFIYLFAGQVFGIAGVFGVFFIA